VERLPLPPPETRDRARKGRGRVDRGDAGEERRKRRKGKENKQDEAVGRGEGADA